MEGRHVDGRAIRALREQQGYRQVEFADKANVSIRYLKYIEGLVSRPHELTRQPSIVVVYRIARALDVDIDAFSTPTDAVGAA